MNWVRRKLPSLEQDKTIPLRMSMSYLNILAVCKCCHFIYFKYRSDQLTIRVVDRVDIRITTLPCDKDSVQTGEYIHFRNVIS